MSHDVPLIAMLAVGFALAFGLGFVAQRLRLPPLVGYLLAGVVIGPFTPGFVADAGLAAQLAEVGVMLLMFGVGLHFSAADLMAVRWIALPGAVLQITAASAIGAVLARWGWGWSWGGGIVLGLSLSVASTVVLLKALEERNGVSTPNGRIAVGWLIVEDLAMVLVLVLLPAFAEVLGGHALAGGHGGGTEHGLLLSLVITLAKVGCFVALVMILGPRVVPWVLRQVARTGSRELFTLSVLALALGVAFGSAKLFGVSFALGAFFAGVVLSESELSHKAAEKSLPLQDAFAVIFFVSVGMLFDPTVLVREPAMVLAVLSVIVVGKSLVALGLVMALGYPLSTGLSVSAALAQIGEFSFILAGLGIAHGLLPQEGLSLILAGALLSITLNPVVFFCTDRFTAWVKSKESWNRKLEDGRQGPLLRLEGELAAVRERLEKKTGAHKAVAPEELVRKFPLFGGLPHEQLEALMLHFHPVTAQPGERVIRAGDKADCIYFIASGQVEVAVGGRNVRLRAGDFFGEMALLSGKPRSADVTALDFSEFLILTQADFRAFARKYPEMRRQVAVLAAQRGESNQQWLDGNGADEAQGS